MCPEVREKGTKNVTPKRVKVIKNQGSEKKKKILSTNKIATGLSPKSAFDQRHLEKIEKVFLMFRMMVLYFEESQHWIVPFLSLGVNGNVIFQDALNK